MARKSSLENDKVNSILLLGFPYFMLNQANFSLQCQCVLLQQQQAQLQSQYAQLQLLEQQNGRTRQIGKASQKAQLSPGKIFDSNWPSLCREQRLPGATSTLFDEPPEPHTNDSSELQRV
jgi:hypothetical protein